MFVLDFYSTKGTCIQESYIKRCSKNTVKNIAAAYLLKNISIDSSVPIFINNDTDIFLLNSYVRRYHAYMDVWNTIINDSMHSKNEKSMNSINGFCPYSLWLLKIKLCWARSSTFITNILSFFEITWLQYVCKSK